jgi:hypothetical protein
MMVSFRCLAGWVKEVCSLFKNNIKRRKKTMNKRILQENLSQVLHRAVPADFSADHAEQNLRYLSQNLRENPGSLLLQQNTLPFLGRTFGSL